MSSDIIAKLNDWKNRFYDESNLKAVWRQLLEMLHEDIVFRVVLEDYNRKVNKSKESKELFGNIFGEHIVWTWFRSQCSYIRMLNDNSKNNDNQNANSLRKICLEIEENASLLTREIYFRWAGGISYCEIEAENNRSRFFESILNTPGALDVPCDADPKATQRVHLKFDRISTAVMRGRSRGDVIKGAVFRERIKEDCFEALKNICNHTSWHIAHNELSEELAPRAIQEIHQSHEALCSCASGVIDILFPMGFPESFWHAELAPRNVKAFEVCLGMENSDWIQDFWKENNRRINRWFGFEE